MQLFSLHNNDGGYVTNLPSKFTYMKSDKEIEKKYKKQLVNSSTKMTRDQ